MGTESSLLQPNPIPIPLIVVLLPKFTRQVHFRGLLLGLTSMVYSLGSLPGFTPLVLRLCCEVKFPSTQLPKPIDQLSGVLLGKLLRLICQS